MKNKLLLALLIITSLISGAAYAADGDLFSVKGSNAFEYRIQSDGTSLGTKPTIEIVATSDTITVAESGKTFVSQPVSAVTLTLPDAAVGLNYTFVLSDTTPLWIDPQDGDLISSYSAGDRVGSPASAASGDTVYIFAIDSTRWRSIEVQGDWVDAN